MMVEAHFFPSVTCVLRRGRGLRDDSMRGLRRRRPRHQRVDGEERVEKLGLLWLVICTVRNGRQAVA